MAKIPLRAYLKEIENLIERGEIEQAIAHGKNILRAYPKHIETYRLLGKAFLESQRYSEASDILQRVLSVVPDDFVSQIGMSIIREDEGNMDAAIWHMERAYEVQPFNPAVQDELRRLYGRRDGIEPPKIRLTRGALVRMYTRGELYPQAIAETRAALAEDPQRLDLRVLLARLYHLSGQKNDAAEVCSELIGKLPYCFEANRLLAEILPTTSRAEETPKFQQRIYALDPYEAFVSPSAPTSQQVPDQAVMVEQFLWEPGAEVSQVPEWTRTVGVAWEENEEENLPDWLNTLKPETPTSAQPTRQEPPAAAAPQEAEAIPSETAGEEDLVPDWMKDAGWAATDRSAEEIMAEQGEAKEEEIRPAEIPDWLQSMAPPEAVQNDAVEEERTEWLESIFTQPAGGNGKEANQVPPQELESAEPAQPTEETPDWLSGLAPSEPPLETEADGLPDWLSQAQSETEAASTGEEMPDWSKPVEPTSEEPVSAMDETPDWLKGFGEETSEPTASAEGLPGWAMPVETQEPVEAAPSIENISPEEEATSDALPDWLSALASDTNLPETETAQASGTEISEVPASETSEIQAPEFMAEFEEVQAEVEPQQPEPAAELPDWFNAETEEPALEAALEAAPEPPQPEGKPSASTEFPPQPDLSDIDATMAWLEALAARQGADEATLITAPENRTEVMPDWVQKEVSEEETAVEEQPAAEPFTAFEADRQEATLPAESQVEAEPLAAEAAAVEAAAVEATAAETTVTISDVEELAPAEEAALPEWLAAIEQPQEVEPPASEETSAAQPEAMPDFSDMDAAMAWLESLAAKQGADEATLITAPEDRLETPPEWVKKEMAEQEVPAEQEVLAEQEIPVEHEASLEQEISAELEIPEVWETAEELSQEPAPLEPVSEVDTTAEPETAGIMAEAAVVESATEGVEAPVDAELPDWLTGLEEPVVVNPEQEPSEISTPDQPVPEVPAQPEAAVPDFTDMDAAMAWLEALAAKQGADEATLVTPPEQRTETMPDWVQKEAERPEQAVPTETAPEETPAIEENIPGWLAEETASPEMLAAPEMPANMAEETEALEIAEELPAFDLPTMQEEVPFQETLPAEEVILAQEVTPVEDTPEWLQGLEEEAAVSPVSEEPIQWGDELDASPAKEGELPEWLKPAQVESQPAQAAEEAEGFPEWLMGLEEEAGAETGLPEEQASAPTGEYRAAWEPEIAGEKEYQTPILEPTPQYAQPTEPTSSLLELQAALNRGDLDLALDGYGRMIQKDEHIEEVIHDLRDALYRFPVDIFLWQTLGDAYARNNQLQEALDAYTKAEELLR